MVTFTQQVHTQPQVRGRGARSNSSGRYESQAREAFDDGWTPDDVEPVKLKTTLTPERARVIISKNTSPDVGFSRSINPYRGCEHGCIYCYARPAHAYMGLSPGLDFESKLFFKPEAASLLEAELSKPRYQPIHRRWHQDRQQILQFGRRIEGRNDHAEHGATSDASGAAVKLACSLGTAITRKSSCFVLFRWLG